MSLPESWPFAAVYLFFVFGAAVRSSCTYALGRYARLITLGIKNPRSRLGTRALSLAHRAADSKGAKLVARYGSVAIPFAFLTIGLQTLIIASAGIAGITWRVFILSAIPGWLAWATIYTTIGLAAWKALVLAAAGSPVGIALISLATLTLIAFIVIRSRKEKTN